MSRSPKDLAQVARCRAMLADGTARRIRQNAKISMAEMAAVIGVSTPAVAHYEAGRRIPRADIAKRYAAALDRLAELQVPA